MKTRQGMMMVAGCLLSTAAWCASPDASFAMKAGQGNMAEVAMGRVAESHASNADVKAFGSRMVHDHSAAEDKLKEAAAQEKIELPSGPSSKQEAAITRLSSLQGQAFDQAYAPMMVQDHKQDISEYKQEIQSGRHSPVQSYAKATLPTLQEHLRLAEKMPGTSGTSNGQ